MDIALVLYIELWRLHRVLTVCVSTPSLITYIQKAFTDIKQIFHNASMFTGHIKQLCQAVKHDNGPICIVKVLVKHWPVDMNLTRGFIVSLRFYGSHPFLWFISVPCANKAWTLAVNCESCGLLHKRSTVRVLYLSDCPLSNYILFVIWVWRHSVTWVRYLDLSDCPLIATVYCSLYECDVTSSPGDSISHGILLCGSEWRAFSMFPPAQKETILTL